LNATGTLVIQTSEPSTADGQVVLSNSQGTVTLHLTAVQGGPAMLTRLQFTVVSGTGAYAGATGSGSVQIEFGGPRLTLDPYKLHPYGGHGGSFALTFGTATPPVLPMV
jgi:hypothetical protein